jgi:hypothetical protein
MTTRCLRILSLMLLVASSTRPAPAETDSTQFNEVIAQSERIAIVLLTEIDFRTSKAQLKIEQVLKGTLQLGTYQVNIGGDGFYRRARITRHCKYVAFIDHANVWRFVGLSLSGSPTSSNVLQIWGFNDDEGNIHFVTPGVVTLAQLTMYLNNKTLPYVFRGDLYFPQSGGPGWQSSRLHLSGKYDPLADAAAKAFARAFDFPSTSLARVKGFPALAVYPFPPDVNVANWDGACLNIKYSTNGNRALELRGNVVGIDPQSGEYLVNFAITQPTLLTADGLTGYLTRLRPAIPSYTFHLKCAQSERTNARDLTLVMAHDGRIGQIYGWRNRPLEIAEAEYSAHGDGSAAGSLMLPLPSVIRKVLFTPDCVMRTAAPMDTGEFLILAFDLGKPPQDEFQLDNDCETTLLFGVWRGHTRGRLQIHDGKNLKTIASFSVSVDPVEFKEPKQRPRRDTKNLPVAGNKPIGNKPVLGVLRRFGQGP